MKIRHKISLSFLLSGTVLVVLSCVVMYWLGSAIIREGIYSKLRDTAKNKSGFLTNYLSTLETDALILSNCKNVHNFFHAVSENKTLPDFGLSFDNKIYKKLYFASNLFSKNIRSRTYNNFILVSEPNAEIIYSADHKNHIGVSLKSLPYKNMALAKSYFYAVSKKKASTTDVVYYEPFNKTAMFTSMPIYNNNGLVIGALILQTDINKICQALAENADLGKTGETYVIGQDYTMRFGSKLSNSTAILKQKVSTDITKPTPHKNRDEDLPAKIYIDYRGIKVLGACIGIPGTKWLMIVEQDEEEAFAPINRFMRIYIFCAIIITGIIYLLYFGISKAVTKPLIEFHNGIKIIDDGNLNHRLEIQSSDEIGQIAKSFNRMIETRKDIEDSLIETQRSTMTLLSNLPGMAYRCINDRQWTMDFLSEGCFDLTGYNPSDILFNKKISYSDIIHKDDRDFVWETVQDAYATKTPFKMVYRIITAEGREKFVWEQGRGIYSRNGELVSLEGFIADITDQKYAEENLKMAMEKLERSNKELEHYAYIASHDLQEPLRILTSYLQLLYKESQDKLDENSLKYVSRSIDNANRLKNLISGLLAYSRIDKSEKVFEPIDTNEVLTTILDDIKLLVKETNAVITSDNLPVVIADKTKFGQVMQNLIVNAVKFKGGDAPKIHISANKSGNKWVFSVEDNGIGIDPNHAERIFILFERLSPSSHSNGAGIGLAICKKIIEYHGGNIWVTSQLNQGSTFYFSIPVKPVA